MSNILYVTDMISSTQPDATGTVAQRMRCAREQQPGLSLSSPAVASRGGSSLTFLSLGLRLRRSPGHATSISFDPSSDDVSHVGLHRTVQDMPVSTRHAFSPDVGLTIKNRTSGSDQQSPASSPLGSCSGFTRQHFSLDSDSVQLCPGEARAIASFIQMAGGSN